MRKLSPTVNQHHRVWTPSLPKFSQTAWMFCFHFLSTSSTVVFIHSHCPKDSQNCSYQDSAGKKNGLDPNLCENYCPVSNHPCVSKLLELVAEQSVSHLNQHDLLAKFQSAYRPGHSCETAILRVLNDVLCSAASGEEDPHLLATPLTTI